MAKGPSNLCGQREVTNAKGPERTIQSLLCLPKGVSMSQGQRVAGPLGSLSCISNIHLMLGKFTACLGRSSLFIFFSLNFLCTNVP